MQSPEMLINAIVDEDCKMREIVQSIPVGLRDESPGEGKLGLKDTLAHLSYWDEFTVKYFESIFSNRKVPTPNFKDFEAASSGLQSELKDVSFSDVMDY